MNDTVNEGLETRKPVANPLIVLREEFDDWAILFDPDSNITLGINPIGVYVWKLMGGNRTIEDVLAKIRDNFEDVSDKAVSHLFDFLEDLIQRGLATLHGQRSKRTL